MSRRVMAALVCSLFLCMMASAQQRYVNMRVMLSFANGSSLQSANTPGQAGVDAKNRSTTGGSGHMDRGSALQISIRVIDADGSTVAEASPDTEGMASFRVLGSYTSGGTTVFPSYRIRVFGPDIEEQWAESVQPGSGDQVVNLALRHKGEKNEPKQKGMVSATGLKIPKSAQKELEKGNKALLENKLEEAKTHFTKATELYPQFDQAYNNLGVVLLKIGDSAGGKAAFEKAVALNDKFARAYVNLAKIAMQDKHYDEVLVLINKSLSVEPLNTEAISTACQADAITERFEDVVVESRKLHGLPHDGMTLCHFAAGVALTNLKRTADAITEYNLFLSEANPSDALVPKAREAVEEINKQAAAQ